MNKQAKKRDPIQSHIFSQIREKLKEEVSLVDYLSDLLNLSTDATYRRIRGDKELSLSEVVTICTHFNISIDSAIDISSNDAVFKYKPLDLNSIADYQIYMNELRAHITDLRAAKHKEVTIAANDIPVFHFLNFKELTLFKVFAWTNSVSKNQISYSDFIKSIESEDLMDCFNQIAQDYKRVPSVEVWTTNTIDPILRLLDFYTETGFFGGIEIPLLLCNQLLDLIDMIKNWSDNECKCGHPCESTYKLYISDIELDNSFILLNSDENKSCIIKLYTINSLQTTHTAFIEETEKWINSAINKSVLISGVSERERFRFFNSLEQKVRLLIDKIEHSKVSGGESKFQYFY